MDAISVIKLTNLKSWHSPFKNVSEETSNDNENPFKFEVCPSLNKKIYLW